MAILKIIALVAGTLTAVCVLFSAIVRVVESVYQLSQTPGLNTFQKCIQVVRNFFTVENYKKEGV